jgi:TRAP-type C4-dicarboxylate transport system permease small subunit
MASKTISALGKAASSVSSALKWLCVLILVVMLLMGTVDVLGRYLFNHPLTGTYETFGFLLPALVLFGLSYAQSERAHVRIELVFERLPRRVKAVASIFTSLIALGLTCLIFWGGLKLSIHNRELGKLIDTIHFPIYITQFVIPIGALALGFVLLVQIIEYLASFRRRS